MKTCFLLVSERLVSDFFFVEISASVFFRLKEVER